MRRALGRVGRCASTLLMVAAGPSGRVEASAWNPPQGTGLVIADYTFTAGSSYFNGAGKLSPAAAYASHEGYAYVEYGVADWLMAVVKPAVASTSLAAPGGLAQAATYRGLGTSEVGAQLHLLAYGPAVLAVQGSFRLPATVSQTNPALIGNTSRDVDLRALAGLSFAIGAWPAFVDAQAAYRLRIGDAPDEWHTDLTFGLRPIPRLLFLVQSTTSIPLGRGTPWFPASLYTKLGTSLVFDLTPRWSIEIGLFETLAGVDALRERGVRTAVWHRF